MPGEVSDLFVGKKFRECINFGKRIRGMPDLLWVTYTVSKPFCFWSDLLAHLMWIQISYIATNIFSLS